MTVCGYCGKEIPQGVQSCINCDKNGMVINNYNEPFKIMSGLSNIFKNFKNFKGRSGRNEFWMASIGSVVMSIAMILLALVTYFILFIPTQENYLASEVDFMAYGLLIAVAVIFAGYHIGVIVPLIALNVRRVHDLGWKGWAALVALIPGAFIVLGFMKGKEGTNEYGTNPADYVMYKKIH